MKRVIVMLGLLAQLGLGADFSENLSAAQAKWQAVCPPAQTPASIIIAPIQGDYYSVTSGHTIYLNSKYQWTVDPITGIDIDSVLLHEVGHTLGLQHNPSADSVMYPYVQPHAFIHARDIDAIQSLYNFVPSPIEIKAKGFGRNARLSVSSDQPCYWDFGDGTTLQMASSSITHRFPARGIYNVTLKTGQFAGSIQIHIGRLTR